MTATSPHAFTSAQPVGRNLVAVNQQEVASAPAAVRAPAVVPPKQAVLGAGSSIECTSASDDSKSRGSCQDDSTTPATSVCGAADGHREESRQAHFDGAGAPDSAIAKSRDGSGREDCAAVQPGHTARECDAGWQQGSGGEPGPLNTNRPVNNAGQTNTAANPANTRAYNDRPPTSRPTTTVNPQLEQKHQQQIQQLQQKQDQEYQKLQQKQNLEQQKTQQQNIQAEQQKEVQLKQQQQLEQLQQKHQQEQQNLKQKQETEHAKAYKEPPPKAKSNEDKPHK